MSKIIAVLFSIIGLAQTSLAKTECYKNTADQNVKQVCLLRNSESKIKGFLLLNANGTKSYLAVWRETHEGYVSQEYGNRSWNYFVKFSDSKLNATGTESSKIIIKQSWEYSDGITYINGQTPGGRRLHATIESGDTAE